MRILRNLLTNTIFYLNPEEEKKILIAPLDWGLGHISRTIPIIKILQERGHEVITCGNKISYNIYKKNFQKLNILKFKATSLITVNTKAKNGC